MTTTLHDKQVTAPFGRRICRAILFPLSNPFPLITLATSVLFLVHFWAVDHPLGSAPLTIGQTVHCVACIALLVMVVVACAAHIVSSILMAWTGNGKLTA